MKKLEKKFKNQNALRSGLTLVETLVAISILLMSVVGPIVIYARSISDARYAKDKMTAYYLAQEAIELVRFRVGSNLNSGYDWFGNASNPLDYDLYDCNDSSGPNTDVCTINSLNSKICKPDGTQPCDSNLYINSSGVYYNIPFGVSPTDPISKFSRIVFFNSYATANTQKNGTVVSSTVSWKQSGTEKKVTLNEYITDWR
jgi:Tfp pilus assembly protein PilV